MSDQTVRIMQMQIGYTEETPDRASAYVRLDINGAEIPISIPLKRGPGIPGGHAQVEQIFRAAADAVRADAETWPRNQGE